MRISDWSSDVCSSDLAYRRADAADHQPDAEKPDGMDPQATAEPRRAGTDHVTDTRHNHAIDLATESEAMASRNARPTRETQWLPITVVIAAGIIAALQVGKVSISLPELRAELGLALGTAGWVMGK